MIVNSGNLIIHELYFKNDNLPIAEKLILFQIGSNK